MLKVLKVLKVQNVPKVHSCSKRVSVPPAKSARACSYAVQKGLKKRMRFPITPPNEDSPGGVSEVVGKDATPPVFQGGVS